MKEYLNKLIGNQKSIKKEVSDFRKVYVDSKIVESLISLQEEIGRLDSRFADQVRSHLSGAGVLDDFSYIMQSGVRGIALCKMDGYSLDLIQAYLFKLKKRHLAAGYVQKLSVHTSKKGKETYSYYLKPSLKLQNTQPAEQLFGNIKLDLELHNSIPKQLKCVSTYYSDANYKTVRNEEEWLSVIFLDEKFNL